MLGAIIGGALGLAGSVLGGNSQNKAAQKAADTSLAVAQQNNALARDIYQQNQSTLSPYVQRGNAAGDQINALLGLGGGVDYGAYVRGNPDALANWQQVQAADPGKFRDIASFGQFHYNDDGARRDLTPYTTNPAAAAGGAFDAFRNSTGYQFRQQEGMNALNNGFAGAGLVRSGAAMKASQEYGQNLASGEFGNYLGYLSNQQGVGLSGASALAGVGQNYTNTVSANNNSAGTAAANAALVKGNNNPFANALSLIGGGLLGYGGR